jgi:hypothetical protein
VFSSVKEAVHLGRAVEFDNPNPALAARVFVYDLQVLGEVLKGG